MQSRPNQTPECFLCPSPAAELAPGKIDEFLRLWEPLAAHCLEHEPETFSYEAAISDKEPDTVIIFERYRSKESLTGEATPQRGSQASLAATVFPPRPQDHTSLRSPSRSSGSSSLIVA